MHYMIIFNYLLISVFVAGNGLLPVHQVVGAGNALRRFCTCMSTSGEGNYRPTNSEIHEGSADPGAQP